MSKVAAQTGHRPFQMTDSVHDLLELAFNSLLAGLTSFQVLKAWQEKKPELFVKRVHEQTGLDN